MKKRASIISQKNSLINNILLLFKENTIIVGGLNEYLPSYKKHVNMYLSAAVS